VKHGLAAAGPLLFLLDLYQAKQWQALPVIAVEAQNEESGIWSAS
jgi:hypothetical protein